MNVLSLTTIPDMRSAPHRRVGSVTDKVQLAPTSRIAVWGLFLTAIIAGFSGVWIVVGAATQNTECMVKLETAVQQLTVVVGEMSQNNAMLALHANQIAELQKVNERFERLLEERPITK